MKKFIIVLGAAGVVMLLLILARSGGQPVNDPLGRPSITFTDATGTRASYLLVGKIFGSSRASVLRAPLWNIESHNENSDTIVVNGPSRSLLPLEADALDMWIENGGQLLLFLNEPWHIEGESPYLARHGLTWEAKKADERLVEFESSQLNVQIAGLAEWSGTYETLDSVEDQEVAISIELGKGRIVVVPDSAFLSNQSLREADNGVWFIKLIQDRGEGKVFFDEHHLGFGSSKTLMATVREFLFSTWGLPFLQLIVTGLLYLVIRGRPLGKPIIEEKSELPNPALLLQARAGLFRAASARTLAINRMCNQLSYELRTVSGKPATLENLNHPNIQELLNLRDGTSQDRSKISQVLRASRLVYEIRKDSKSGS